eukprot:s858_g22.t2
MPGGSVFSASANWLKLQPQLPTLQKRKGAQSAPKGKRKQPEDAEGGAQQVGKKTKRENVETAQVKKGKKNRKASSLTSMIQLELGRWEIMDSLVEAYDQHVSPVLGGNDTLRNEQKRKRHLESWLWSRLFFPLLPLGEPTTTTISAGDEALQRKLCNAGLSKKEARRRIERLATVLSSEIQSSTEKIVVQVEEDTMTTLKCGKRQVQLLPEYFAKLKSLTQRKAEDFNQAAFLVLARYRILQVHDKGGGNQGAIPPAVFNALREWWPNSEPVEAFASPLNTLAGKGSYHSAFSDTDGIFGSRGSFFDSSFEEGLVEVNPPFDEDLVLRAANFCQSCLEEAELGAFEISSYDFAALRSTSAKLKSRILRPHCVVMSPASESSTEFESCASLAETMAETVAETVETADTVTAITAQESFDEAYEELEQLGRGEFGIVRRAFHRKTGRQVAVKHMPKTTKSREELANLSQLTGHENIAKLLNHYETDEELLLVLELCDEGSLSDFLVKHLKGRRLGDEECALLMKQLLSAVKHCHDSGLVHNDLKFDNIMLASSAALPKLKLIDFGNAQSSTKKAPVDDMWFVGIIFYQLITGQPFFQMDSDELESMDEQGVFVDPGSMQCDAFYVQLRLSVAKRFGNSITLDLLSKMLQTNRNVRITATDALDHPFLLRLQERFEKGDERRASLESLGNVSTAPTLA